MSNILEMTGICKQFPGVIALKNVNLAVKAGEVLALMGENGAGKSTLIKILAGVYEKDQGQIIFDGKKVGISSPRQAHKMGISTIFQELNLLPNLNVAENIFMGDENRLWGAFYDYQSTYRKAQELMKQVGLNCDPKTLVKNLPVSQRQMVEVAKALSLKAKLIIMDEPTSSLTEHETQLLFKIIRRLKAEGVAVIYISHRMNEIFEIADRVVVLRDGMNAGELERHEMTEESIIQMMVGRELKNIFAKTKAGIGPAIFAVQNLSAGGFLSNISFSLKRGEILGIAGLVGAGRTELIRAIFGLDPRISGKIIIDNQEVAIKSPKQAIRLGMAFVTEDRRGQGLITGMSVRENCTLVTLKQVQRWGFIKNKAESFIVNRFIQLLRIKTPSIETKVATLSGGNQQKVVLAKWLAAKPRILILDEPTRGIDVGAKAEIHRIMSELACQGVAIIMISSELPEIMGMSDRIIVMHEGRVTGELNRDEATQEKIMTLAIS
ncbi:MAG: sugar ABC transporter ATP-binding protein [Firmicutes bacterium]|nr:sugar ABC transporter ATP-binding protein [Bacillota bacterium]